MGAQAEYLAEEGKRGQLQFPGTVFTVDISIENESAISIPSNFNSLLHIASWHVNNIKYLHQ